jgi:hypothetical protein
MIKIVHVTPHLGGGVGRVLSQVARYNTTHKTGIEDSFLCLEAPEKTQFVTAIQATGSVLTHSRASIQARELVAGADIVQLEWWHHPLMAQWLHDASGLTCRLAIWSHTSGLHYPAFPEHLVALPHVFMATTKASFAMTGDCGVRVVPSSGGFEDIPLPGFEPRQGLRYGYLGSLNDAKLHPGIMGFLAAAGKELSVKFYGDADVGMPLHASPQARIMGYTNEPTLALSQMDVFVYLLNPQHYGTTENALLEAMAAGVVPIVLNNPVESAIVRDGETGLIVDSPTKFAEAVHFLDTHPDARLQMGRAAAEDVRGRFSLAMTADGLAQNYQETMRKQPKRFDFRFLGDTPFDWFCAGLGRYAQLFVAGSEDQARQTRRQLPFLYEERKSSAAHFFHYFPEDTRLKHWAAVLNEDRIDCRREE